MPLETATYISGLVQSNPAASDPLSGADDHLRLIKATIKNTFPNFTAAPLNSTQAQLDAIAALLVNGVLRANGAAFPGMIADYAGASAPSGWLVCDGQAVSRTTYADLYAAIGTTWGGGDGSTTFNVPNLQNRFRRHRNGGSYAGAVGNLQNPANLAHTHAASGTTAAASNDHTHAFSGTTAAMNSNQSHSHSYTRRGGALRQDGTQVASVASQDVSDTTGSTNIDHTHNFSGTTGGVSATHTHTFSITTAGGSADDANESRPFSATVLSCIKT
jgi:microcystin-dependent protein